MEPFKSPASRKSSSDRQLGKLLQDDYFLLKILTLLVDDGLHECRRVCRKWYKVCNELPVAVNVPNDLIPVAVDRFPNATAVSGAIGCCSRGKQGLQFPKPGGDELVIPWFSCLSQFKRLHGLKLSFDCKYCDGLGMNAFHFMLDETPDSNQMYQQLCSLEISARCASIRMTDLFSGLRRLTNLRKLCLEGRIGDLTIEPFTELRKIEDLRIRRMLTNSDGELLFPVANKLTHILFCERSDLEVLETLLHYSHSLISIQVDVFEPDFVFTNEWSLATVFTKLESIELNSFDQGGDIFLHLEELSTLTHLSVTGVHLDSPGSSVFYPIGLKSLELNVRWSEAEFFSFLTSYERLTHLTLDAFRGDGSSLTFLTGLKDLKVHTMDNAQGGSTDESNDWEWSADDRDWEDGVHDVTDWNAIITGLTQLERLDLGSHCRAEVSVSGLARLKKLASLSLTKMTFRCLGYLDVRKKLPELTELKLIGCFGVCDDDFSNVNSFKNLQTLWIIQPTSCNPCDYFENGSLLRLREIRIPDWCAHMDKKKLFAMLPSLRHLDFIDYADYDDTDRYF